MRFPGSQKLSEKLLQHYILLSYVYYAEVSLLFSITPKHTDAFVTSWYEFKNSIVVETGLLYTVNHKQPFSLLH